MSSWPAGWRIFFVLLLCGTWMGCVPIGDSPLDEEKDPNFIEGRNHYNAMDYKGAIEAFERAVQANPRSAAAHFELGLLYQKLGNYASAVYHYQKHLEIRPQSTYTNTIKEQVTTCIMELTKTVSFGVVTREVHQDLQKMSNQVAVLYQQNLNLQRQLAAKPVYVTQWMTLRVTNTVHVPVRVTNEAPRYVMPPATNAYTQPRTNAPSTQSQPASRNTTTPTTRATVTAPTAQKYVVKQNETMSQIARKFNLSMSRLQAANPTIEPRRLRAGQTLNIPAQ